MVTINILVAFIPVVFTMAAMWINCYCLDSLPKHAFAENRHHTRWATVFLFMTVAQIGVAGYMAVDQIEDRYQLSLELKK